MISAIRLKDVTKYYYSDTSVTLGLRKINMEFKLGEFVVITGESGSGKSTLLNVISGMDTYEEGELYFGQQETSCFCEDDWENYRKNHISLIYQSYNLIDSYTALENIESVLLICEETIGKMTKKERKDKALHVLEQVGLERYANHKASHLSSGQKQRLGIARALAKNTDIIIADEPTGNLDIENGKAVMEILHKLSKDKLVIVVTHNYEQAEPYADRKIRLFDGEIAEDIVIKGKTAEEALSGDNEDMLSEEKKINALMADENRKTGFKESMRQALRFVELNMKGQPHRTFFMFMFILIAAAATMIFIGTLSGAGDDIQSKNISTGTFANTCDNRIIVRRSDGNKLTDEDYKVLNNLNYVIEVDRFDGVNDINYFYRPNEDYSITYDSVSGEQVEVKEVSFFDRTQFVHSASCLTKDDLAYGRLPEKTDEIVIYSEDSSAIGKEIDFYFYNSKLWSIADYVGITMKVVGILKNDTSQVYFSNNLAKGLNVKYEFDYDAKIMIHRETTDKSSGEVTVKEVSKLISAKFIMNDNLESNQIKLSNLIFDDLWIADGQKTNVVESILEDGSVSVKYNTGVTPLNIDVNVLQNGTKSSVDVVEVSEEIFNNIFTDNNREQCSVFIRDYAYTDEVINALNQKGYEPLSVVRFSATSYNKEKLKERMIIFAISAGATLVIFVLGIFVLSGMLRMKKGDFFILRSLGLDNSVLKKINYISVVGLTVLADVVVVAVVNLLSGYFDEVNDIIKYADSVHYAGLLLLNIVMAFFAAKIFNNYLLKTFRITVLREE